MNEFGVNAQSRLGFVCFLPPNQRSWSLLHNTTPGEGGRAEIKKKIFLLHQQNRLPAEVNHAHVKTF